MASKVPDLTFTPEPDAVAVLRSAWSWLLREPFHPVLFSVMGDVFFRSTDDDIYWLNTGLGEVTRIADSEAHFRELLETDQAQEWLLPSLVKKLKDSGKGLSPGRCYTFVVLPIFAEGKYEVSNLNPVPAKEHFAYTGDLHRQLRSVPDGSKVKVTVVP
jgi:hypothetical protein